MTPWLGTPTSYASGYMSAQRVVSSSPPGPWPPTFQSLTVELSSPPTYWMGLLTRSSRGSRALNRDSPGIPPWYVGRPLHRKHETCGAREGQPAAFSVMVHFAVLLLVALVVAVRPP